MIKNNSIYGFVLSTLAVWRLTHRFAEKDVPWGLTGRLHGRPGASLLGRLLDFCNCLFLWLSLPLAIWLSSGWIGLLLQWQALSGAACLLEKITHIQEPVFFRIQSLRGDTVCAAVRGETD